MGLLDNLLARWGYQRKTQTVTNPPGWLLADAGAEKFNVPTGALFEAQAELMQRLSLVNIAVSLISRSAAVLDLNVLRMEGEETVDIPNHDFERLLWHPNPLQSRFEFLESTFAWRCLTGNCYWWLNRSSEKAEPSEIWIIPSNKISPVPDDKMYLRGYVYDYGASTMALEPWEIVHFKSFHPLNPWVGLSPIESLAIIATADLEMQKWNLQLFGENAARLPGILAFASNINDNEWGKMKQDINDKASKRQIMMLRNTQSGGVQFIQAAVSQKDMEFLASRQATKEEIFNAFGPGLVAMLDKNATEANARSAKATFTEYTLWPLLDSVAQKATQDVLPAYGENLRAQFDDPRVTDRVLELQEQAEYSKVHTLDEIREKYYGDPPLAEVSQIEADKRGVMLPAQVSPTTPLGDEPEPEPQPAQLQQPPETMGEQTGEVEQPEQEEPEPDAEVKAEIRRWRRKALRLGVKRKVEAANFQSDVIGGNLWLEISGKILAAETEQELKAAFKIDEQPSAGDDFAALIAEMKRANDLLEYEYKAHQEGSYAIMGGQGSGNFGHSGRPGMVGGSGGGGSEGGKTGSINQLTELINNPDNMRQFISDRIGEDYSGGVGLRGLYEKEGLGKLRNSHVWEDGERLSDALDGVSTIGIASNWRWDSEYAINRNITRYSENVLSYGDGRIGLVIGDDGNGGEDEGELIIPNARVVYIWEP